MVRILEIAFFILVFYLAFPVLWKGARKFLTGFIEGSVTEYNRIQNGQGNDNDYDI